ncbi:MAG TPA: FAD-binding protein [Streptosporangiaceae bacterium]|nr:FAD-binding protein [Streptosporangiaceae bacterium]
MPPDWDVEADVVVVGFGAAGACAALEAAAAGCSVLILDRFGGGGATALSGGVVYAGGGTPQQRAAGVTDTPEAMLGYLRTEVGDAVPDTTLREFCDGSAAMLAWLEGYGVPFEGSLCPDKTSYPTNRHYLYYSGSELSAAQAGAWPPAPRGHRTRARGTSGGLLYARLAASVHGAGARVLTQTAARQLVTDPDGRVTGVECRSLRAAPGWVRLAHRVLHRWSVKPYLYVPKLGRILHRPVAWLERRYARPLRIGAAHGVILAAGGFAANRAMMRAHAPNARGGLPLATPGDDGSGIGLGTQAGGATAFLERVSVWRFLSPPSALLAGVLVDRAGQRVCDESRYGAALGDAIIRHGGRAWLFVDRATRARARRQVRGSTLWFQRLQAWYLLSLGAVRAPTVAAVAVRAGVDPDGLAATVATYNAASRHPPAPDPPPPDPPPPDPAAPDPPPPDPPPPDPAGKPAAVRRPQDQPPYYLIDVSVRPRLFYPAPVLTLGGLVVAPGSGQVLRPDGHPVDGLYAAGRTAAGLCSRSYVSGLSLADCVFSGRRAGHHAATEAVGPDTAAAPANGDGTRER